MIKQSTLCSAIRIPRNCQPEKKSSIENRTKQYSAISPALFTLFHDSWKYYFLYKSGNRFLKVNHLSISFHQPY